MTFVNLNGTFVVRAWVAIDVGHPDNNMGKSAFTTRAEASH
jgi:hypothetical protein